MDPKSTFCYLLLGVTAVYAADGFLFPDQINSQAQANSNAYSDNSGNSHASANSNAVSNQNNKYPGFYKPTSHDFPIHGHDSGFHPVDPYSQNRPSGLDYDNGPPSYDPYAPSHPIGSPNYGRPGFGGGSSQANANSKSETSNGSSLSNAVASSQSANPDGASAAAAAAAASAGTSFVNGVPVASAAAAASAAVASQHGGSASSTSTSSAAGGRGSAFSGPSSGLPQYQRPHYPGRELSEPLYVEPQRSGPHYGGSFGNNGPFYAEARKPWQYRSGASDRDDDDDDDGPLIHDPASRSRSSRGFPLGPSRGPSITITAS